MDKYAAVGTVLVAVGAGIGAYYLVQKMSSKSSAPPPGTAPQRNLKVVSNGPGSVKVYVNGQLVVEIPAYYEDTIPVAVGSTVKLAAIPNSGAEFYEWGGLSTPYYSSVISFTMPNYDVSITAIFYAKVVVRVADAATGMPIQGATVTITPGGTSKTTGWNGTASFLVVTGNTYCFTATAQGYAEGGECTYVIKPTTITIYLNKSQPAPSLITVDFHVQDADTGSPIAGATVHVSGGNFPYGADMTGLTDSNGDAVFQLYPASVAGSYTVTVSASGYQTKSWTVSLPSSPPEQTIVLALPPA